MGIKLLQKARITEVDDTSDRLVALFKSETALAEDAFLKSLFTEMETLSANLTEAMKRDKGVSELEKADKVRNNAIRTFSKVIEGYRAMPIATVKQKGERLHKVFSKYGLRLIQKNYTDKSSYIAALLKDLQSPDLTTLIAELQGVTECIDGIRQAQEAFNTHRVGYEKTLAHNVKQDSATQMKAPMLTLINEKLVPYATTMKMVDATKYRHFADTITQIITDTNTAIKVRSTRSAKGKDTPTTPAKP